MSREPVMNDVADICPSTYGNVGMGSYFLWEVAVPRDERRWGRRRVDEANVLRSAVRKCRHAAMTNSPAMNHRSLRGPVRSQTNARL